MTDPASLSDLIAAIVADDGARVTHLLAADPALARAAVKDGATRQAAAENYFAAIGHYVYAGDTALHVAAAGHRPAITEQLLALGADVHARNRRKATPLHYAADGAPGAPQWNPDAQAAVITALILAGADPNALDQSGVAPLHRAVRTRCAAAVRALLFGGADPRLANKSSSTPLHLANQTTGRGGSGSPEAKAEQVEIVALLEENAG
jgi:hypothetical protein